MKTLILSVLLLWLAPFAYAQPDLTLQLFDNIEVADTIYLTATPGSARLAHIKIDGSSRMSFGGTNNIVFEKTLGFSSVTAMLNLSQMTDIQKGQLAGEQGGSTVWITAPVEPGKNFQWFDGDEWRTPLHVSGDVAGVGDGPLIIQGDTVFVLDIETGGANQLYGLNEAGDAFEWKGATTLNQFGDMATAGSFQAEGSIRTFAELQSGRAGILDGGFRIYNDANAFTTFITTTEDPPTGNRTVYAGLLADSPVERSIGVGRADGLYDSDEDLRFMPSGIYANDDFATYFLQPLSEGVAHDFQTNEILFGLLGNGEIGSIPYVTGFLGIVDSLGTPKMWGPRVGTMLYEDWISTTEAGNNGWTTFALNGTADAAMGIDFVDSAHSGVAELSTGNSASGIVALHLGASTTAGPFSLRKNGGTTVWEALIYIDALSDGSQAYDLFIGFNDDATGVSATANGIYFWYNHNSNTDWILAADSATSTSTSDSDFPVTTGWTKLRMEISTVSNGYTGPGEELLTVAYYINDISVGAGLTVPIAPVGLCFKIVKQVGTTPSVLAVDYMSVNHMLYPTER